MGEEREKYLDNDKFLQVVNQIKLWCDILNMTPSQFFATPEEELKLRLKNLKGRLRLNVAKNVIAYQKERMDELERRNEALMRAQFSQSNEEEYKNQEEFKNQGGYKQQEDSGEAPPAQELQVQQPKIKKQRTPPANAVSNKSLFRKAAADQLEWKNEADEQCRTDPTFLKNIEACLKQLPRVRAGANKSGNTVWDLLCQSCAKQPQIEDESWDFTDPNFPNYCPPRRESLPPEDITGSSFEDGSYGIRGFQQNSVREMEPYGQFQPCPVKQSTPYNRMRARPICHPEDTWQDRLADESVNFSDPYEGNYTLGERCPCPANRIYTHSTTFGSTQETSYEECESGGTYDASGGTYEESSNMSGRYDSPCPSSPSPACSPNRTSEFEDSGQREFDAVFPPPGGRNPPRRKPVSPPRSPSPPPSPDNSGQAEYDAYFAPPRPRCKPSPPSPQSTTAGSSGRSRTMSSTEGSSRGPPVRTFESCGGDSTYNTTAANTRGTSRCPSPAPTSAPSSPAASCPPRNRTYNSYGAGTQPNACRPTRTY